MAFTGLPARHCPGPSFLMKGKMATRREWGDAEPTCSGTAGTGKPCSPRMDWHRREDCPWGLEASRSSETGEPRAAKAHSLWILGNENDKASQRRDRPAGKRGANVLTSDMCQQHSDAPLTKTKALRVCGFPRHKRQILGAGPWNEVDIWPCTLGLLLQIFWDSSNSKWKSVNEYNTAKFHSTQSGDRSNSTPRRRFLRRVSSRAFPPGRDDSW